MSSVHDFNAKALDGSETPLSAYKGKTLLIVNTASQCGFTYQYEQCRRDQEFLFTDL